MAAPLEESFVFWETMRTDLFAAKKSSLTKKDENIYKLAVDKFFELATRQFMDPLEDSFSQQLIKDKKKLQRQAQLLAPGCGYEARKFVTDAIANARREYSATAAAMNIGRYYLPIIEAHFESPIGQYIQAIHDTESRGVLTLTQEMRELGMDIPNDRAVKMKIAAISKKITLAFDKTVESVVQAVKALNKKDKPLTDKQLEALFAQNTPQKKEKKSSVATVEGASNQQFFEKNPLKELQENSEMQEISTSLIEKTIRVDRRVYRWWKAGDEVDFKEIRGFSDRINGVRVFQYKYLDKNALQEQFTHHSFPGLQTVFDDERRRQNYTFPTDRGFGVFCLLIQGSKKLHGNIYFGIDQNKIYHMQFVPLTNAKTYENLKTEALSLTKVSLEDQEDSQEPYQIQGNCTWEVRGQNLVVVFNKELYPHHPQLHLHQIFSD